MGPRVFRLNPDVPPLPGNLTPENINQYLIDNPSVTTTAQFMRALPEEFRKGWILMSRSESLQTGTARFAARHAAQRGRALYLHGWAMRQHASYPGSHPERHRVHAMGAATRRTSASTRS